MCWLKGLNKSHFQTSNTQLSCEESRNSIWRCLASVPKSKKRKTVDQPLLYSLFPVTSPWICKGQYIKTFQSNTLYCPAMKERRNVPSRFQEQIRLCNSVSNPVLGKRLIQKTGSVALSIVKISVSFEGVVKKRMSAKWMEDTCLLLPFTVVVRAASQAHEVSGCEGLANTKGAYICVLS